MASKKTKRVAVVTAVSASLMMAGAAAFAKPGETDPPCPRGQWNEYGKGLHNHDEGHPGNGYDRGWPHKRCNDNDNDGENNDGGNNTGGNNDGGNNTGGNNTGGNNTGGNNTGGNNTGGGTVSDDHNIDVDVTVQVDLPNITLPDASSIDGAMDNVFSITDQTVTLAESDVAGLMTIVQAAGQGTTSLINGTAQAGVSVTGTSASGTLNVSSGAAGATTFGSNLAGSTLNLVKGNVTGGGHIVGSMLALL